MNYFMQLFILIPLLGFVLSLLIKEKREQFLSYTATATVGIQLFTAIVYIALWAFHGFGSYNIKDLSIYQNEEYQFFIDFYFDKTTAVYLLVGAFLSFMVVIYSRYYLHREPGYKRFFNTILFFFLGYNLTIFAGNFETLFIGWEILGISSFLLIAFYRERFLPVKNAMKVFSIYRIGDIGLLLAMWMSHHLWHENITFQKLHDAHLVHEHLMEHSLISVFISLMILVSASAKSAQLPFSFWLPRAMEGPTPSSAIFYGSLSVHVGAFLLMRTHPFWENQLLVKIIIVFFGLMTMVVTTAIARVQSSVKSQIAYSSISQIGIIFIEIALGFENLALVHIAGNAFLRTYQLLVSPSIVSYLIREQFYNYSPHLKSIEYKFPQKIQHGLYILSIKEWNLDSFMYEALWNPIKKFARSVRFLNAKNILWFFIPTYILSAYLLYHKDLLPKQAFAYLPIFYAFIGLLMVLKSFSERRDILFTWILIIMSHFWIAIAIGFNANFDLKEVYIYLSGILFFGGLGFWVLKLMQRKEEIKDLTIFHGHVYEHPRVAQLFFLCCLGLTGFPISPTFVGEDLLFSHIEAHQVLLVFIVSFTFIIDGLSIIRIYARIFMGTHVKKYHEIAFKSS